jgi:prevent-host-death family protein
MKLAEDVKSISYLKAHASELIRDVTQNRRTMVITQHGEAKVVIQDARAYDELMQSLALLKMLGQSTESLRDERGVSLTAAAEQIRAATGQSEPT